MLRHDASVWQRGAVRAQVSMPQRLPKRRYPTSQRVRAIVNGAPRVIHVCTRCLRSGSAVRRLTVKNRQFGNRADWAPGNFERPVLPNRLIAQSPP